MVRLALADGGDADSGEVTRRPAASIESASFLCSCMRLRRSSSCSATCVDEVCSRVLNSAC